MSHPIMVAAAKKLVHEEERRTTAREVAFRTWGARSVTAASKYARNVLGAEAVTLAWEALGVLGLDDLLQAVVPLDTVAGQHLELYYSGDSTGTERLALRRSCITCPTQYVDDVTSLEQFGRLLSQTAAWQSINPRNGGGPA
ncbi:DUF6195 family protein [Streptomyces sp. UNOC14_S4]|uniref:DUF6195 family protein n=1 Tax=Streptomyces sp. UNOC14_S4 TaxID=2872340 RepID=UPI001E2B21B4|nr:DUF6195 family protein [Streptomyces sp. UNOC14_S4]MCC3767687.1 hypothetical protein [Streptomyces sp. UNOC14_S4]